MTSNEQVHNATADVTGKYFQKLAEKAAQRARDRDKPFPPTWDPAKACPNPLQVVRWPGLEKVMSRNGDEWLKATVTHSDGSEYTLWVSRMPRVEGGKEISSSLFKALKSAGVEIGKPVSILRSLEPRSFGDEGHTAYEWQIGTQAVADGLDAGQRVYDVDEVAAAEPAVAIGPGGELPPGPVVDVTVVGDDGIPF